MEPKKGCDTGNESKLSQALLLLLLPRIFLHLLQDLSRDENWKKWRVQMSADGINLRERNRQTKQTIVLYQLTFNCHSFALFSLAPMLLFSNASGGKEKERIHARGKTRKKI